MSLYARPQTRPHYIHEQATSGVHLPLPAHTHTRTLKRQRTKCICKHQMTQSFKLNTENLCVLCLCSMCVLSVGAFPHVLLATPFISAAQDDDSGKDCRRSRCRVRKHIKTHCQSTWYRCAHMVSCTTVIVHVIPPLLRKGSQ